MKLDRSKPFGEIWGGDSNARYEQDGVLFDVNGDALEGQEEAPRQRRTRKAAEPEQPALDPELEAQITANLEG